MPEKEKQSNWFVPIWEKPMTIMIFPIKLHVFGHWEAQEIKVIKSTRLHFLSETNKNQ